jgi:transposase
MKTNDKFKFSRTLFQEILKTNPDQLFYLINELIDKIDDLTYKINNLESLISKDSHNSSKPPSSDGLKKKPIPKSLREKSGKQSGGQKGHPGKNLKIDANPDKITRIEVCKCEACNKSLQNEPVQGYEKRQVKDIELKTFTEEFQAEIKICSDCHKINTAKFPHYVSNTIQYGLNLKSLIVYLRVYNIIPADRLTEICADIFNIPLSEGTIFNITASASNLLIPFENWVKFKLLISEILHVDESGLRIEGKLNWLHSMSNKLYTYYFPHSKRGNKAMDEIGILPYFKGYAIHDFWKSYQKYNSLHGLCNEHHIRELTFLKEEYCQEWAKKMISLLYEIKDNVEESKLAGNINLDENKIKIYETEYLKIIEEGFKNNPYPKKDIKKRGKKKKGKILNLLERFKDYMDQTLAFMYHFKVPFTNNQAEQDIRMIKVVQKVFGCFRSMNGAKDFLRIRSFISTSKKHQINILDAIKKVFEKKDISYILAE